MTSPATSGQWRVGAAASAAVAGLAVLVVPGPSRAAAAQLIAAKDGRVVMGHVGLNSTSHAEHARFWSTLGGTAVNPFKNRDMFQFPNIYVSPGHGSNPTGGTSGTTVDHIAFRVAQLETVLSRMVAIGYPQEGDVSHQRNGSKGAFLMGPDGIKIELLQGTQMPYAIAVDHVHYMGPDATAMRDWYVSAFDATPAKRGSSLVARLPGIDLLFDRSGDAVTGTVGRVLDHVTFEVKDLAAFCDLLRARGIRLDRPYSRVAAMNLGVAFLTDPWGTSIELTEGYDRLSP